MLPGLLEGSLRHTPHAFNTLPGLPHLYSSTVAILPSRDCVGNYKWGGGGVEGLSKQSLQPILHINTIYLL